MPFILTVISAALLTAASYYPKLYFMGWIGFLAFFYYLFIIKENELKYKNIFFSAWMLGFWILFFSSNFLYHSVKLYTGAPFFIIIIILISLFLFLSLIYPIFLFLYFYLQQSLFNNKKFNPLLFAICWTTMEFFRYYLMSFFPLANLSYTQTEFLTFIQLAEIGGIWILTFILVLVNGLIFQFIFQKKKKNIFIIAILFIIIFTFANFKDEITLQNINETNSERNISIGIITTKIQQKDKWTLKQLDKNIELTLGAVSELKKADLIIAPETNLTFDFYADTVYRENFLEKIAAESETLIQIGSLAKNDLGKGRFNSAFLISASGEIISRYNKNLLLYFGEKYPFTDLLNSYTAYNFSSLNSGKKEKLFKTKNFNWKTIICSEILYPTYVKRKIREVDFIVNQTNEAWFNNSKLLKNIMWQAAVLRAVENRMPVLKTGNYSYNGIIYPSGKYKKVFPNEMYWLLNLKI